MPHALARASGPEGSIQLLRGSADASEWEEIPLPSEMPRGPGSVYAAVDDDGRLCYVGTDGRWDCGTRAGVWRATPQ